LARELFLDVYKSRGFRPDHFAGRRAAREAALEALVRAEDYLETLTDCASRRRDRAAVRHVRRALESDLWP